jgi:hypothetical protein
VRDKAGSTYYGHTYYGDTYYGNTYYDDTKHGDTYLLDLPHERPRQRRAARLDQDAMRP